MRRMARRSPHDSDMTQRCLRLSTRSCTGQPPGLEPSPRLTMIRLSTLRSWLTMQPRTDLRRRSPLRRPNPRKHVSPGFISSDTRPGTSTPCRRQQYRARVSRHGWWVEAVATRHQHVLDMNCDVRVSARQVLSIRAQDWLVGASATPRPRRLQWVHVDRACHARRRSSHVQAGHYGLAGLVRARCTSAGLMRMTSTVETHAATLISTHLLHGEALLVLPARDLEDVALELLHAQSRKHSTMSLSRQNPERAPASCCATHRPCNSCVQHVHKLERLASDAHHCMSCVAGCAWRMPQIHLPCPRGARPASARHCQAAANGEPAQGCVGRTRRTSPRASPSTSCASRLS